MEEQPVATSSPSMMTSINWSFGGTKLPLPSQSFRKPRLHARTMRSSSQGKKTSVRVSIPPLLQLIRLIPCPQPTGPPLLFPPRLRLGMMNGCARIPSPRLPKAVRLLPPCSRYLLAYSGLLLLLLAQTLSNAWAQRLVTLGTGVTDVILSWAVQNSLHVFTTVFASVLQFGCMCNPCGFGLALC